MSELIVISALGSDRPGLVQALTATILEKNGNILDSRMTVLGGEFAILMLVQGDEDTISLLMNHQSTLENELNLTLTMKRTQSREANNNAVPYKVEVVSMDHPGIVHDIADFFSKRSINIDELNTGTYSAPHTGTTMFDLHLTLSVPAQESIGKLREAFLDFCEERNLDANFNAQRS